MPIHDKSPRPQEFAAVDLGSNSFHMVIARVVDGAMQIIGRLKQRVHLADGLGPDNMLSEEAMTRGLNCLSLFAERLQGFSPASVCILPDIFQSAGLPSSHLPRFPGIQLQTDMASGSVSGSMPADVSAEYGGHKAYPALRSELLHTSVLK